MPSSRLTIDKGRVSAKRNETWKEHTEVFVQRHTFGRRLVPLWQLFLARLKALGLQNVST
jgi:hypothetical protein